MQNLKAAIEHLASLGEVELRPEARETFLEFRHALTAGKIRAAEKRDGKWAVNTWVKQGILLGFRLGELSEMGSAGGLSFADGHSEIKKWRDNNLLHLTSAAQLPLPKDPNSNDLFWLQDRTTSNVP